MMSNASSQEDPLSPEPRTAELRSEYDFSAGVRGKYWAAYQQAIAAGKVGPEEEAPDATEADGKRS